MSTDSRHYNVPHIILLQITRCLALFTLSLFPVFTKDLIAESVESAPMQ